MSSSEALEALARREYERALALLEADLTAGPEGELHALAGLAGFQLERYDVAVQHYAAALQTDGERNDWREMLVLAQANAAAGVNVPVPERRYFDRAELLARPSVGEGVLPAPLPRLPGPGPGKRLRLLAGNTLGVPATGVMYGVTHLWGRVAGHLDTGVWTNWYHRHKALGVLTLAYMREQLNQHNLSSSYPEGTLVGFQPAGQIPPPGVTRFRTADGSWNNLADPMEGAAGTRFLRNVKPSDVRPETGEQLLTPNPREISRRLLTRTCGADGRPAVAEVPFLNMLAASWIQFMNGDWINHGEILFDDVIEVPLPQDDPARDRYLQNTMRIGKTQPDPTRVGDREPAATSSINEVTHWWDGSQIYGSDQATQDRLRSRQLGKMRIERDGTLPVDSTGVEITGYTRNWWVGLAMLHTLFVREHNAICDMLHEAYPDWDDNRLFNVARLINAAVMAKIHSVEWTPAILPNHALDIGLNANWFGLLNIVLHKGKTRRTLSSINIRNPEIGGIVGNPVNKHRRAFGLTEEFVEVYRLHSMLPETLRLRRRGVDHVVEEVPFPETRQSGSAGITERHAMSDLFYSFGNQHPGKLELNNFPRFMQELSIPGNAFFDMGAVDIVRARERGVPRYNQFRRQLRLKPIRSFDDLSDDVDVRAKLKSVYGDKPEDVEKLDLLIGTLAEAHRPTGFGFGETLFQIFILNASRRLQADRFYTDCFNDDVYTREGMQWIDQTDLKTVLLRHHPELADTGLANIKNAFEPWDEGPILSRERHPLRAYDSELKRRWWRGDGYRHG